MVSENSNNEPRVFDSLIGQNIMNNHQNQFKINITPDSSVGPNASVAISSGYAQWDK